MTCIGRQQNTTKRFFWVFAPTKNSTILLKENRVRRHLWTDLYQILTHDVYRPAVEHCKEIFWVLAPNKIWKPKIYLFSTTWQLNSNFEGQYLRWRTWESSIEVLYSRWVYSRLYTWSFVFCSIKDRLYVTSNYVHSVPDLQPEGT